VLRLHDTATGEVSELELRIPGEVSMYVCGLTVYDAPHLGHGRMALVFDVLRRYLLFVGLDVTYVSNITDIDDKVIERAAERGVGMGELTTCYEEVWWEAVDALDVLRPDQIPHATAYVERMVEVIGELVSREVAYETSDGVYLSVDAVPGYGLLAHQPLESLRSGARVEALEEKRSPLDFVLWKKAKPGEPTWDSPWGPGRPGWHTECVVMSLDLLGDGFDLHGGGLDLVFPHHENERAQAVALGRDFAHHWVHNGWVTVDGEKMSKSLGNDVSLRNVLDTWDREVVLLFFLGAHWRKPVEFGDDVLVQARAQADAFRNFFLDERSGDEEGETILAEELAAVLDDDFNTPEALALFHAWRDREEWASLRWGLGLFGLGSLAEVEAAPAEIAVLAEQRREARDAKDFAGADRLRDEIAAAGWEVRDVAEPPGYRLVRRP
jgi:cysteinyl-tRNA synthetase